MVVDTKHTPVGPPSRGGPADTSQRFKVFLALPSDRRVIADFSSCTMFILLQIHLVYDVLADI